MPGITNPAEEYFKDGVWGWVTDQWKKVVATAGGALHIQFVGQEADVEVKQTTPADLTPGVCGWDGSAWRKLPVVWGYSEPYGEFVLSNNVAAGGHTLTFSTVPDGEVWVITSFLAYCTTANPTRITLQAQTGGVTMYLWRGAYPTAEEVVQMTGSVVLKKDDELSVAFTGCALNDNLRASACGYKMKVAE